MPWRRPSTIGELTFLTFKKPIGSLYGSDVVVVQQTIPEAELLRDLGITLNETLTPLLKIAENSYVQQHCAIRKSATK